MSIGRRVQDPLAELVKIDPKHIGIGTYQVSMFPFCVVCFSFLSDYSFVDIAWMFTVS